MFKIQSGSEKNNKEAVLAILLASIDFSKDYSFTAFMELIREYNEGEISIADLIPYINYYRFYIAKDYNNNIKDIDFKRVSDSIFGHIFNKIVNREITELNHLYDLVDIQLIDDIEDAVNRNNKASEKAVLEKLKIAAYHKISSFRKKYSNVMDIQSTQSASSK